MADYKKTIVTYITKERNSQFQSQVIREGTKPAVFARKLLKLGIDKYNEDRGLIKITGHMNF